MNVIFGKMVFIWQMKGHLSCWGLCQLIKCERKSNIWPIKGCDIEYNIGIKQYLVEVTKVRCSISQKVIFDSSRLSKSNTECVTELKKNQTKQNKAWQLMKKRDLRWGVGVGLGMGSNYLCTRRYIAKY